VIQEHFMSLKKLTEMFYFFKGTLHAFKLIKPLHFPHAVSKVQLVAVSFCCG